MAANVIRQFLVGLGWDIDVQGMNRFASTIAVQTEAVRELAEGIKGGARAVVDFVRSGVEGLDNLYFASIRTRSSVATLQALKYAAEQTGLPFEALKGNLIGFRNWLENYGSGAEAWLHGLGVSARDSSGKLRDLTLVYREAVKAALSRPNAVAYLNQLGIDRASAEALASPAADRYFAERQKMGAGTDEQGAAENARRFEANIVRLDAAITLLKEKVVNGLAKAWDALSPKTKTLVKELLDVGTMAEKLIAWWNGLSEGTRTAIKWIAGIAAAAAALVVGLAALGSLLALGATAFSGLAAAVSLLVSPVGLVVTGLGLIGVAVSGLIGKLGFHLPASVRRAAQSLKDLFGPSSSKTGSARPRGLRNNNPGNINAGAWANAHGATGVEAAGRFAVFGTAQAGLDAAASLLHSYAQRGIDSVRAIISKYAPRGENNTEAYIASVAKKLGVDAGAHLNLNDPAMLAKIEQAIVQFENGRNPYSAEMYSEAARSALGAKAGQVPVITQHVTTTVTGTATPKETAEAVGAALHSANGLLARSLQNRTS